MTPDARRRNGPRIILRMLTMTPAAAAYARDLAARRGCEAVVRVRVIGGGCSGLTWDLMFGVVDEQPGDLVWQGPGARVLVDAASAAHVRGAVVDLGTASVSGLRPRTSEGPVDFVLRALPGRNPCGCGESFEP